MNPLPIIISRFSRFFLLIFLSSLKGPDIAVVSDQIIKVDTTVLNEIKRRADDTHAQPFDDLRNYAYEGHGSTAGSLSSVLDSSGTKIK